MSTKRQRSPAKSTRSAAFSWRAALLSALTVFGATVYALIPEWRHYVPISQWAADISTQLRVSAGDVSVQLPSAPIASAPGQAVMQPQFSECPQFFVSGAMPRIPRQADVRPLCYRSFAILHSGVTKTPVFVAQRLNRNMLQQAQKIRRTDSFYEEARLPARERALLSDYRGSGYSRGHMAPAADMDNDQAMAQSFSLANMVPQDQRHNAGAWSQIEQDTRKYIARARGDVYVFTGPVYGSAPEVIGEGKVAVPAYLFKLVYDAAQRRAWVHWQANSPSARAENPISYAEFVHRTGLRLLPDNALE